MPCRSGYEDVSIERHDATLAYAVRAHKNELDRVSAILCRVMRAVHDEPVGFVLIAEDSELRDWWDKHQRLDAQEGRPPPRDPGKPPLQRPTGPPPSPIRRAIPTYADGFIGIRRPRGLWHRLCIRAAR